MKTSVNVYYFADANWKSPVFEWIESLPNKIQEKAETRILRLEELGHKILNNRNEAAYLREGICELRWDWQKRFYRLLFFFHGQKTVILTHGMLKKTDSVPSKEINRAIERKKLFESNPDKYTFKE